MAQFPHVLAAGQAAGVARSAKAVQSAAKPSVDVAKELAKLPPLNVETLSRVLRTLFLWTSWIHEDVGHSFGSFIYNPVHTPGFVPADGKGIPTPALIYRVAMFRNFVAVERSSRWPIACNPLEPPSLALKALVNGQEPYHKSLFTSRLEGANSKERRSCRARFGRSCRIVGVELPYPRRANTRRY